MKKYFGTNSRLLISLVFIVGILSISDSCKKSTDTTQITPGTNEVLIQNMAFSPGTITVSANTTITWTNKDAVNHTVTSTTGLFDSGTMSTNGTYSHLFTTTGTFPYICTVHPSMTAKVIVN